jgi:hypothetical protein
MAAFEYKIETIEDYDDDAITEAALNALSFGGWELKTVTYQPDETSGKSTATLIYIKNLSSSSSSLSSSTSSSSSSTSSNSDAPFMGAGWPYLPDAIEVTIGDRWYFDNVEFVEDEVMILKRYGEDGGGIFYSED